MFELMLSSIVWHINDITALSLWTIEEASMHAALRHCWLRIEETFEGCLIG
jgi:hypothetical protein